MIVALEQLRDLQQRFIFQGGSEFANSLAEVIETQSATIASLRQQLQERERLLAESQEVAASSQAREKVLRDALNSFELRDDEVLGFWQTSLTASQVDSALSLPSDSTALDAAIRQAKRGALLEAKEWCLHQAQETMQVRLYFANELRRMADNINKGEKNA